MFGGILITIIRLCCLECTCVTTTCLRRLRVCRHHSYKQRVHQVTLTFHQQEVICENDCFGLV